MQLSEKFDEILPALHKARSQFVKVKKDKINGGAGKSKYATLDSVLDTITPALTDNGIMVMQDMAIKKCAETANVEKILFVETVLMHISGQWAKYFSEIPIVKNDPQGVGSAFTYARRYALAAALGLSQADDDAQIAVKSAQDWKRDLDKCENLTDLQEVFKSAYKASDPASRQVIKNHYDELKAKIEIGNARGFTPVAPKQNLAKTEVKTLPNDEVESQPITDFE